MVDIKSQFDCPVWGSVSTRSDKWDKCHGVKAGGIAKRFARGIEYDAKIPDEVQFIINLEERVEKEMDSLERIKVFAQQRGTIKRDKKTQEELKIYANELKDEYIKMFTGYKLEIVKINQGKNGKYNID